ncbi:MAG: LamG domain-containing protein [Candidatus Brocadiaceae bacterium]|nr:LamG domain-containing protein [Candidatus Brocadiaceae bacterium]
MRFGIPFTRPFTSPFGAPFPGSRRQTPTDYVAKYSAFNPNDFSLVTGNSVNIWDDKALKTYSSELVTNGSFDTDLADWGTSAWFWDSGKAKLIGDGTVQTISQLNVFEIGKIYLVEFDVESSGSGVGVQSAANQVIPGLGGNTGRVSATWKADRTGLIFKRVAGTVTATLDNISVKEVLTGANDLTQGTSANQPSLTQNANPALNKVEFGPNDFLEDLPPQSGDFTYVVVGLDITNYTSETNRILGEVGQSTSRIVNMNGTIRVIDDLNATVFTQSWNNESNIAIRLISNVLSVFANGTQLGSDTDVTGSTFSNINSIGGSGASINGSLQGLEVFDRALSDQEIKSYGGA